MTTDERLIKENFNPRPREEGDFANFMIKECTNISIHALVKRATRAAQKNFHGACISIHALVKRATTDTNTDTLIGKFQSTPS